MCLALSPDDQRLAVGFDNGNVHVLDARDLMQRTALHAHARPVTAAVWTLPGRLVTADLLGMLVVWATDSWQEVLRLSEHEGEVTGLCTSASKKWLASTSVDGSVHVWGTSGRWEEVGSVGQMERVAAVAWSPTDDTLATSSASGTVTLWDAAAPVLGIEQLRLMYAHTMEVTALAFSRDGQSLASGSLDKSIRVWAVGVPGVAVGSHQFVLQGHHSRGITTARWGRSHSDQLISGSLDGILIVWSIAQRAPTLVLHGHSDAITGCCIPARGHGDQVRYRGVREGASRERAARTAARSRSPSLSCTPQGPSDCVRWTSALPQRAARHVHATAPRCPSGVLVLR